MKIRVNFTLFSTPVKSFAIIEGWMDVADGACKGDHVHLEWPDDLADYSRRSSAQKIEYIVEASDKYAVPNSGVGDLYSLDDIVMENEEDAERLANFWHERYGFHVLT